MGLEKLALMCALMTVGQVPADVFYFNQRNHKIPLQHIPPHLLQEIKELQLFSSSDQGGTWEQRAVIPPTQDGFVFYAPADGEYWLKVVSLNRQGQKEPANLHKVAPDLRMVIDTLKPLVNIPSVQRVGDEILVSWEIQEGFPDWSTFKLEYQAKELPGWKSIPASPQLLGQARFRPGHSGPLTVRLQLRDLAGNSSLASTELGGITGTVTRAAFSGDPPGGPTEVSPPPPLPTPKTNNIAPPPGNPESPPQVVPQTPKDIEQISPPPGGGVPTPQMEPKVVASSDGPGNVPGRSGQKSLPPIQHVSSTEVVLDYELSKVGPSGIGSVDLWWTQNDGQSWERYAWDPEVKGLTKGMQQRTIELPGDGLYGFCLIVKNRAGLGKPTPRAGDVPELRIQVDTVAPTADMDSPVPDPQRPNTLILSWNARDDNLPLNPITWEWSEGRDGPWRAVSAPLANTGKYAWSLPDSLPVQVYLRLRVRDQAGNVATRVTPEPQIVDLHEPEGRLVGASALPRR